MVEVSVIIAVVVALAQVTKMLGLQTKYISLLNLALGTLLGVLFLPFDIKMNVFQGLIIGLSASGLYDHSKIMKKDVDNK
ncbi:holin [Bacillus pseudomycoides]|nr:MULTISPECIES: hypothetical protein [Bacillus]EEM01618.1 Holin [Bacillus pseudomycoides]EEM11301.1 Holin [Bacillus pseudomycoides]KFN16309.1 putative holin [Bacillus pseudomycoides]MCR8859658.1 holin [Bacillus pseudomycoides]MCX2828340.1 holin [Bacillus sp. DHT2]